jgi:hypothetical protein
MSQRREDLTTADLAGQQPTDTAPPDRGDPADAPSRDFTDDDLAREDLAGQDRERDGAVAEEARLSDQGRGTTTTVGEPAAEAAPDSRTAGTASTTGPLMATEDAEGFRARWTDVQTGFVDAPRRAVEQADELVAELMQHLARTFADERGRLEGQWDRGDDVPTDNLRDAFQRYRSFFERLLAT